MANFDLHETGRNKVDLVFNILAHSDIIKYFQNLSRNIKAHSEACVTPVYSKSWYTQKPRVFRTLTYSEPLHIQNFGIFRTLAYSEPWYI